MGPSSAYHSHEGADCETSVKHGLPLWTELTEGYCSQRLIPSSSWGSRFVGACESEPWLGEQKPRGKTTLDQPQSRHDLPTYLYSADGGQMLWRHARCRNGHSTPICSALAS